MYFELLSRFMLANARYYQLVEVNLLKMKRNIQEISKEAYMLQICVIGIYDFVNAKRDTEWL